MACLPFRNLLQFAKLIQSTYSLEKKTEINKIIQNRCNKCENFPKDRHFLKLLSVWYQFFLAHCRIYYGWFGVKHVIMNTGFNSCLAVTSISNLRPALPLWCWVTQTLGKSGTWNSAGSMTRNGTSRSTGIYWVCDIPPSPFRKLSSRMGNQPHSECTLCGSQQHGIYEYVPIPWSSRAVKSLVWPNCT